MSLQGADALRLRLAAIAKTPERAGSRWADETVRAARPLIPVRTGATRASVRVGVAKDLSATVVGKGTINFIDAGSKAHDITAGDKVLKFSKGGQAFFRRKVHKPRIAARPFKRRAAETAFAKLDLLGQMIKDWNAAA